ncbi:MULTISPECIES: hypothetical protein, partial [unclassified Streptococcus]
ESPESPSLYSSTTYMSSIFPMFTQYLSKIMIRTTPPSLVKVEIDLKQIFMVEFSVRRLS